MYEVETKKGKHLVKFYYNPKELPIRRYAKFNKHSMIQMQVGNGIDDYNERTARAVAYFNADDKDSGINELTNRQQCVYNAMQEYQPKGFALAVLLYSIDDKVYDKFDDNSLDKIQDKLDEIGFTQQQMDTTISDVKKNSKKSWSYGIRQGFVRILTSWWQGLTKGKRN